MAFIWAIEEVEMAMTHAEALMETRETSPVSTLQLAVVGGVTAAVVFLLCWLGTYVPFSSPTHAYITLFTNPPINSGLALAEGLCWSLLFGLLVGAIFALVYNATAALGRK